MKALRINGQGGPEVLQLAEVPAPSPVGAQVRVRVHAFGLNRADLLQLAGQYPAPPDCPPDIPGLEFAGEVLEAGPAARELKLGDRVMGVVGGGAYAEELLIHEREAVRLPEGMPFEEAAAIPEAFWTAFDALVLQAQLAGGESLLVHAAGSGVGTAAIQIGRAFGASVIGTARTAEKLERCRDLGLDFSIAVEGKPARFADAVKVATGGRGANVALELVGAAYLSETVAAMALHGRVMLVGLLGGASCEVNLRTVLQRRLQLRGTVLRARQLEEKILVAQAASARLMPLFARGKLKPVIEAVLPVENYAEALGRLAANQPFGKLVLTWARSRRP